MLNYIWLGLILGAVLLAGFHEPLHRLAPTVFPATEQPQIVFLAEAAFGACRSAVMNIALPLAGIMALWLGMMRLAEKSGMIFLIARGLRPLLVRLFPDVPANHPAMGSMVMNIAANMLGLANAATPLGLRAMQDLEKINPRPGTASNAMCTFLAINTSSVQLIPISTLGVLAAAGAADPTRIIGTAFIATLCSTIAALVMVKSLERLPFYRLPPPDPERLREVERALAEEKAEEEEARAHRLNPWQMLALVVFFAVIGFIFWQLFQFNRAPEKSAVVAAVEGVSQLAIPFLLALFPLYAVLKRVPVYEEFVEGAKEGIQVAIRIIPFLVAILVAIAVFREAGGIRLLSWLLMPVLEPLRVPPEVLPMALIRPLSGSGALGFFTELVQTHGPDSFIAGLAASIAGSTETTFYVLAVYFGSVAIRRTRHAVPAGLFADAVGFTAAVIVCNIMFAR